ncbi:MAG TPA: M20/M25/M40 family metallo-hydrolase, partial [Longimicrobiales bacterium]|nr:M20/M25/M40 family metallo-hydrolase [Longimicrobiales bacterium]
MQVPTRLHDPDVVRALGHAQETDERTLSDQVALTQVPAPPFGEEERGRLMARFLGEAGLGGARTDEVGNVFALRRGARDVPPVVVSAHLDTVFPPGTDVTVRRDGDLLEAPGISDDGRGLAVLLAVARALEAGGVSTDHPVLFAATVGEEGLGDLRGARHLLGASGAGHQAAAFVSVDGAGLEHVVTQGLGSRRYRVAVTGTGGHSWLDRGRANPIHALARVVNRLDPPPAPPGHEAALTVARWGGGTSINAIPQEAWVEIDCRSSSPLHLEAMDGALRRAVDDVLDDFGGELTAEVSGLGVRPAGATDGDSLLVSAACAATQAVGSTPLLTLSSTDANAAMAAGIPAVTLGGGGEAGLAHTTREWYRNVNGWL